MENKRSKFEDLCMTFNGANQEFSKLRHDCLGFANEIWNNIIQYYEVPDSQISLYRISDDEEFELVRPSIINALNLREDSYWEFGIGLSLCSTPGSLPEDLILIQFLIRRDRENKYFIKTNVLKTERQIERNKYFDFTTYFDELYKAIKDKYDEEFTHFFEKTTIRKLGYIQ